MPQSLAPIVQLVRRSRGPYSQSRRSTKSPGESSRNNGGLPLCTEGNNFLLPRAGGLGPVHIGTKDWLRRKAKMEKMKIYDSRLRQR
jgi:hypothetical protein